MSIPLVESQREHKFLVNGIALQRFLGAAGDRLLPCVYDPGRPIAYTRTTYFDTASRAYYRSSHGLVGRRLRVREYAAAAGPDETPVLTSGCFLELKQSASGLRAKTRMGVTPDEAFALLCRLPGAPFTPCLTTWYRRATFIAPGDGVRITVDDDICFCAPVDLGAECTGQEPDGVVARGASTILEVKLDDEPPAWLLDAQRGLVEEVGFSKFLTGMRAAEARSLPLAEAL